MSKFYKWAADYSKKLQHFHEKYAIIITENRKGVGEADAAEIFADKPTAYL